jgi:hypothetical protein
MAVARGARGGLAPPVARRLVRLREDGRTDGIEADQVSRRAPTAARTIVVVSRDTIRPPVGEGPLRRCGSPPTTPQVVLVEMGWGRRPWPSARRKRAYVATYGACPWPNALAVVDGPARPPEIYSVIR